MSKIEPETWKNKEQTDSDQRGGRRWVTGEGRGRVKSRNVYKGPMDKDNGVVNVFGSGCWMGQGRAMEGKWGQL